MVGPAVVIVKISLKGRSASTLSVPSIDAAFFVVTIAGVPRCSVFAPWAHADPTELVLAFLAGHMVAPAVLLNRALALAALLGITLDPVRRLAVILALLQPQLRNRAHDRPVIALDGAAKAKDMLPRLKNTAG